MNPESPELERLISRYLDDEATPQERRELTSRMRADPAVEALVDEYAGIDREVSRVLRVALGRSVVLPTSRSRWVRFGQGAALAAAACLALVFWLVPQRPAPQSPRSGEAARAGSSWFAPLAPQVDSVRATSPTYERPQVRLRDTSRDWIIIPAERPGEYMLIEVDRVRLRAIRFQEDF